MVCANQGLNQLDFSDGGRKEHKAGEALYIGLIYIHKERTEIQPKDFFIPKGRKHGNICMNE